MKDKVRFKEFDSGCLLGPIVKSKSSDFSFYREYGQENIDNRGFGYDEFSDKITTHGRSHLSLLRESYHKIDLKRKITVVK